jgi:hypothetical protein
MGMVTRMGWLLLLVASGCGPYLTWETRPPAAPLQGKVIVEVRDAREPERGGKDKRQIGVATQGMSVGGFGIPQAIRMKDDTVVAQTLRAVVSEAAQAAGLAVVPEGTPDATAKIIVEVQRFWCSGYDPVYKGDVVASLMIVDPPGQQVRLPAQPIQTNDAAMQCKPVFHKALSDAFGATAALLAQPQVKAAALGAAAPPQ